MVAPAAERGSGSPDRQRRPTYFLVLHTARYLLNGTDLDLSGITVVRLESKSMSLNCQSAVGILLETLKSQDVGYAQRFWRRRDAVLRDSEVTNKQAQKGK